MPLSSETLPNKPLNGQELAEVIVKNVREAISRDCMFLPTLAYGRVAFIWSLTVHTGNPVAPKIEVWSRVRPEGAIEGAPPLAGPVEGEDVAGVEREVTIDNPNLERIHAGLPIKVTERRGIAPATAGDPFPSMETRSIRYEPGDYPDLPPPVDRDTSEKEAKRLGVKRREFKGPAKIAHVTAAEVREVTGVVAGEHVTAPRVRSVKESREEFIRQHIDPADPDMAPVQAFEDLRDVVTDAGEFEGEE